MKESEVIKLAEEGLFNGRKLRAKIEETHISWVLLCKSVVFKIKKPLKLSFLDFSTLRRRKEKCEREIFLNKKFSDIYQRVVPIRLEGLKYVIAGKRGRIIDYAVQLKRLSTNRRMDICLREGRVSNEDMVRLATTLSDIHRQCHIIRTPFALPKARMMFNDLENESRFIRRHVGSFYSNIIAESIRWSDRFLQQRQDRLQERVRKGFKRDVHGDLHGGNIFIYRTPVIFDCIEFNDSFRRIDVLYEIAFLCMDLDKHHKTQLSRVFFSEYTRQFKCVETKEDIRIFNYFKSLRANIRAKVHVIGLKQCVNNRDRMMHLSEIRKYLLLMKRYMFSDKSPVR